MKILLVIVIGYLLGSIPTALLIGKVWGGIDIRNYGSGNLGATNTFRVLGAKPGIIVITMDILKGAIPAFLGASFSGPFLALLGGIAAIIGHSFPFLAKFKGGKGVATGAGLYLILTPLSLIIAVVVFLLILIIFEFVSLASVTAAAVLCILTFIFSSNLLIQLFTLVICVFVIYRHRENIKRLLNGTENKANIRKWLF